MLPSPLIVTLGFDPTTFERLNSWRKQYFPPDRNWIPAHLTLFHQWPGEAEEATEQVRSATALLAAVANQFGPMDLRFLTPRKMGNGVCLPVVSPQIIELHDKLKHVIAALLIPQDRQSFRPHITLQNKVSQETVAATLASLIRDYEEWRGTGTHLCLWRYLGGPWEELVKIELTESPSSSLPNLR